MKVYVGWTVPVSPSSHLASSLNRHPDSHARFVLPDWSAELDRVAAILAVPEEVMVSGMFPHSVVDAAKQRGQVISSARQRYLPFKFYPLREHMALLFEVAPIVFPELPIRQALRKIGRAAPKALLKSTIGRVVLASAFEPLVAVDAFVRSYRINLKPGNAELTESGADWAVVRLERINFLSDCQQIGTLEGFLRHVGVYTEVAFNELGEHGTEYLLRW